ncbi:IS701 family transposase [Acetobacter sp. LMG 1636]|uniref:IS701 family transposase n=1 Tax=Acetobacter fallax TaxID=1737473 RepID=A0ABX0KG41_9PROT|nr:IS701 family transposase [Acetobacter fallax]NHO37493.1 IS701 family transposase [Acetobacter fallax]
MNTDWQSDLEVWLAPFLAALGHKAQRAMCPAYIAGLIGPGDRKSVQPMAARSSDIPYDRLHHFVSAGVWDSAPLEAALWRHADHLVGGERSWLIIDDTSLPKKGEHSVGVAPQYASTLGKKANCQTLVSVTLVSVTLASREVPLMLSLRLFLPDIWTADPARMKRAGVPLEHQGSRTKPEMAIDEIDRLCAAGVRFGCVLADAGYGLSAPFRQALSARNLRWAVGIPRHQKVCSADVELVFPARKRGPSRMHPVPDQQLKEELGLDHFEGRSWTGLHRHALMSMMAYAFLQSRRLTAVGRKKKSHRPTTTAQSASNTTGHP